MNMKSMVNDNAGEVSDEVCMVLNTPTSGKDSWPAAGLQTGCDAVFFFSSPITHITH